MDAETFQQSGVCSAKTLLWIHNVPQEKKIHNVGVEDGLRGPCANRRLIELQ